MKLTLCGILNIVFKVFKVKIEKIILTRYKILEETVYKIIR